MLLRTHFLETLKAMQALLNRAPPVDIIGDVQPSRSLYFALMQDLSTQYWTPRLKTAAQQYLRDRLVAAAAVEVDFPTTFSQMEHWLAESFVATGQAYQEYLAERRAGGERRLFSCKSHALDFLTKSAPTKLVDGSWLYGSLRHWQDGRFNELIHIYLEELGNGDPGQNHVSLYRKLLKQQGCESWSGIEDRYFVQGAIQLALAQQSELFLPEILGFNLGYEQLPLHLPVTAYELVELGIDPYYFTVHITIDNFDNGHARRALAAVKAHASADDEAEFLRRVSNGYRLNWLGAGASDIAASFDLEAAVVALLTRKAKIGQYLHDDRCRIQGRTVNEWLSRPAGIPDMLRALESTGWIKRHQNPTNSRFWKLIEGDRPLMFGVFSSPEKQLIFDWISGHWQPTRQRKPRLALMSNNLEASGVAVPANVVKSFDALGDEAGLLPALIRSMSPASHDSERGLMATRIFSAHFHTGAISALEPTGQITKL
jgi:hypothetical protein